MIIDLGVSRMPKTCLCVALFVTALALSTHLARAQTGNGEMTGDRLVNARKEPQNWPTYFGTYDAWRYSSLNQINTANVKNIVPVWGSKTQSRGKG